MNRTISPNDLKASLDKNAVYLLDVRRVNDLAANPARIPGAEWKNPEQLADWSKDLPRDRDIVLYCVRGGSVSNSVLDHLLAQGLTARFIEGGIEAWKAAGGATIEK